MEPPALVKQYQVIKDSTFTYNRLQIRHNGVPFVWINGNRSPFGRPKFTIHTNSPSGPVVAAAKLPILSSGVDVLLGDPKSSPEDHWTNAEVDGWTASGYSFRGYGDGHLFAWRRTHKKGTMLAERYAIRIARTNVFIEYGSTLLSNSDFKFIDPANNDKVLAVYVKDSFFGGPEVAHIDYFVELGPDLELQMIAVILGIEERLRRRRNASGA